jgi:aspartyl-tRNA synthetase
LPQSPQIFKQILMISNCERYFQIARCFRDEDLRADRQPEFTQIDLEMTFPRQEDVFAVVEGFLAAAWKAAGHDLKGAFPQMSYDQAIQQYGIDKPDLRLPAMTEVKSAFTAENLSTLAIDPDLPIVCVRIPKIGELSRKERDDLKPLLNAKSGAKMFEDFKRLEKSFPEAVAKIRNLVKPEEGDLLVIVAGVPRSEKPGESKARQQAYAIFGAAGQLRLAIAQKYAERHGCFKKDDFRFLWVTDFPFFEWDEDEKRWNAAHHPFTSCHERDMDKLESDPAAVRALAYDVVLNGVELGSGSIRIHRQDVQSIIFKSLGMSPEEQQQRFGFFLEALQYGTPPHGGIALGLDRIVMILAGATSLREVIPFPKTAAATDMMMDAPTPVSDKQLKDLNIASRKRE